MSLDASDWYPSPGAATVSPAGAVVLPLVPVARVVPEPGAVSATYDAGVAERGEPAVAVGGAHGDDTRVSGRVVHRPGLGAVVAGRRDQQHVAGDRVADRGPLGRAAARGRRVAGGGRPERPRVQRQGDDRGAVANRVPDARGDRRGQLRRRPRRRC